MIGHPGPLPGCEPIGACMGTCDHDKCNPEPFYCCDGCDGHMPGEPECPPLDNYDARGIDTAYDEALYRL